MPGSGRRLRIKERRHSKAGPSALLCRRVSVAAALLPCFRLRERVRFAG